MVILQKHQKKWVSVVRHFTEGLKSLIYDYICLKNNLTSMQSSIKQPFNNAQLELLKVFSHDLAEKELLDLRKLIVSFFAEKLIKQADKKWNEMQWTDEDMDKLLGEKLRKSTI